MERSEGTRARDSSGRRVARRWTRAAEFGADTTGPVWHRFNHRCSGCHAFSSPTRHTARQWDAVVERMGENIDSAGLLPLSKRDVREIWELLGRHSREDSDSSAKRR